MPARTLAAARVRLACSNPLCRNSTRHSYCPFTLASLHSHVNWHAHCTCEAFGCFCAPKPRLKPEPSPSPDGLGPKARASISVSLSPPKPGLSRGFQAEPGPHITKRGNGVPWKRVPGMCGDGRAARMSDKVLGEKPKLWGIRTGRAILDPKGLDSVITGSSPKVR